MSSSNTSLNGYEFGRSPRTTAPFWGESGEGAEIDDDVITTDKTWSSVKIHNELIKKANKTELASYAKVTSVYTKSESYSKAEVDALIDDIPAIDAYTKTQTDNLLADKADKSDTYTKTQVDNLIPDVSGLATKTELNSGLASKANAADVYTKTYLDSEFKGISHAFSNVRDQIDTCAKATTVYTKAQTYTKSEVDDLISGATPAPVDAYTKTQTDNLLAAKADKTELADYAKVTSVYTKAQTYTKAEVDDLIEGAGGGVEIDDTDVVANKTWSSQKIDSEIYNATSGKANSADVYTKTQTDNMLSDYAKTTTVYTKSQTYTKTEVDDLISQAGGGGAEIDDTTVAANKVWSSNKTRAELLKASGLQYTSYISTDVSLIRAKIAGSNSNTQNAMKEPFSADYQYSLSGSTLTVTILYADGTAGQSATINLTDIPWNDLASAEYTSNYPDDNARWKRIVASEDIFEVCLAGNVSGFSGYYYPYIFVRVPKGTYTASISLSTNLGYSKWTKAGSVSVINGYVSDPSKPIWTYVITNFVSSSLKASAIFGSTLPAQLKSHFKRDVVSVQKINKIVIEATQTDLNGTQKFYKSTWNVKSLQTSLPASTSQNMSITNFILEFVKDSSEKWVYEQPDDWTGTLYKITETIPSTTGNITGAKVEDTTTTLDTLLFGYSDTSWTSWSMKFCQ